MPFLLRVELPDVPGSLGRLASAIGEAGGDIEAIEIVEKRHDGVAVDDVLLETAPGAMPDSIVSACNALEGVEVVWIGRYAAGGNLFLDLEAVEELTADPAEALDRVVHLLPVVFRADWAVRIHRVTGPGTRTANAPDALPFTEIERARYLELSDDDNLYAGARIDGNEIVVIGRRGGPEFLESELARLGHLVGLATSLARP
ncbi:ACT domain-containing protein [Nocardioides sp. SYSU D00038]|uniref:ACT domain-containing protein n=1 Tax=Nocardioides sp. SYSU D00038 TaxID=2812554 RepID=UPI001967C54F|nr:ACT domain-containing protein [Nocardioides sp. SYSU D00038]